MHFSNSCQFRTSEIQIIVETFKFQHFKSLLSGQSSKKREVLWMRPKNSETRQNYCKVCKTTQIRWNSGGETICRKDQVWEASLGNLPVEGLQYRDQLQQTCNQANAPDQPPGRIYRAASGGRRPRGSTAIRQKHWKNQSTLDHAKAIGKNFWNTRCMLLYKSAHKKSIKLCFKTCNLRSTRISCRPSVAGKKAEVLMFKVRSRADFDGRAKPLN